MGGPGSKMGGPGSKMGGPGSIMGGPGSKMGGPGSKMGGPGSKMGGPGSKMGRPESHKLARLGPARNFILPESIVEVIQGVGLRGWTQETMIKYDHITEAFGKVSCLRFGPSLSCVAFPATRPLTQRILKNRAVTTAACYFSLKL